MQQYRLHVTPYVRQIDLTIFFGLVLYSVQILCDFSGGIDIARGVAQCLGIKLDDNFRRPYFAKSIAEFWRRWHITLGSWMRDYVFYPISFSKHYSKAGKFLRKKASGSLGRYFAKVVPAMLVTMFTFLLIGMWHGASFRFVAFGLYHGSLVAGSLLLEPVFAKFRTAIGISDGNKLWHSLCVVRTFVLICIGRYFSASPTFTVAVDMLRHTVQRVGVHQFNFETFLRMGENLENLWVLAMSVVIIIIIGSLQERGVSIRRALDGRSFATQWAVMFFLVGSIIIFGVYSDTYIPQEFIYQQF